MWGVIFMTEAVFTAAQAWPGLSPGAAAVYAGVAPWWGSAASQYQTRVESAPGVCNQRLKLHCDEPLSSVAFNLNVRRYTQVRRGQRAAGAVVCGFPRLGPRAAPLLGGAVQVVEPC
jgi:hypothetical protein